MPERVISINAAAVSLIAICILSAAILVAVTSSEHPAVFAAAPVTPTPLAAPKTDPPAPKPRASEPRSAEPQVAATTGVVSKQPAAASKSVTITGCLQRDGESFRLADTDGAQAPKSRSWKSGFLKKGNAAVAVVDAGKRLNLSRHVGERLDVTGTLSGKSMQARTVTRVAAKCS